MSEDVKKEQLFMEGMVMNQAFGAPEELRKLLPPKVIDMAKLPAMLRPKAARNG